MENNGTTAVMDYTGAEADLRIEGRLWTGQETTYTAKCRKCGRVGVIGGEQTGKHVVVHRGSVKGGTLTGIDFCEIDLPKSDEG